MTSEAMKAAKLAVEVFAGLTILFAWVRFWMSRSIDHNWPFLPCFAMAVFLPLSIFVGVMFYFK